MLADPLVVLLDQVDQRAQQIVARRLAPLGAESAAASPAPHAQSTAEPAFSEGGVQTLILGALLVYGVFEGLDPYREQVFSALRDLPKTDVQRTIAQALLGLT